VRFVSRPQTGAQPGFDRRHIMGPLARESFALSIRPLDCEFLEPILEREFGGSVKRSTSS
jgi:hypothetical protein